MRYSRGLAVCGFLAATACVVPHNDMLYFATDTKFAIDVSTSTANAGRPELTVGYKRQEGVLMPLIVNGEHSVVMQNAVSAAYTQCLEDAGEDPDKRAACQNAAIESLKYMGRSGGSLNGGSGGQGGTVKDRDAYSVFASFGAKFGASGGADKGEAQGGIAQFFATGVAAQRLGANASIGDALKVASASEETKTALRDQAAAEKARADTAEKILKITHNPVFAATQLDAEKVADMVDDLPPGAAWALLQEPPVAFDPFTLSFLQSQIGGVALDSEDAEARLGGEANDAKAKTVLKSAIIMTPDPSPENLQQWEAAIQNAE